jgi:DNA-binding sugar fermentation-stimulating protein
MGGTTTKPRVKIVIEADSDEEFSKDFWEAAEETVEQLRGYCTIRRAEIVLLGETVLDLK